MGQNPAGTAVGSIDTLSNGVVSPTGANYGRHDGAISVVNSNLAIFFGGLLTGTYQGLTIGFNGSGFGSGGAAATGTGKHSGVLLENGKVLFAGGVTASGATATTVMVSNPSMITSISDVQQVSSGLLEPRFDHGMLRFSDGYSCVFGGSNGSSDLASTEIQVAPDSPYFEAFHPMTTERHDFSYVALGDKLVVVGGSSSVAGFEILRDYRPR